MTGYVEKRAMIIALMAEQHIDAKAMARRLGVTQDYLASLLGSRRPLTVSELRKFADVLDVPVDDLTDGAWFGCATCGALSSAPALIDHTPGCTETDRNGAEEMLPAVPR